MVVEPRAKSRVYPGHVQNGSYGNLNMHFNYQKMMMMMRGFVRHIIDSQVSSTLTPACLVVNCEVFKIFFTLHQSMA